MNKEISELKPIKDIAAGIAFETILETSKENRATRRRMAENLKLTWKKYLEVEALVLKIYKEKVDAAIEKDREINKKD